MIYPIERLYLYVTWKCNMKCKHCWVEASPEEEEGKISYRDIEDAIKYAKNLGGLKWIKISGGEPFIRKRLIFKILELSKKLDLSVTIETNGSLLEEKDIKKLSTYDKLAIGVSLDFPDADRHDEFRGLKGAFKKAVKTISLLSKHGVTVGVVATITKSNMDLSTMKKLTEIVIKAGAKTIEWNICTPTGRAKKDLIEEIPSDIQEYLAICRNIGKIYDAFPGKVVSPLPAIFIAKYLSPRHIRITRGSCKFKNIVSILPNGDVALCGMGKTHPETVYGNIFQEGFKEIWEKGLGFLSRIRNLSPENTMGICSKCVWNSICGNMCPSLAYDVFGTIFQSHPMCQELYSSGLFPEKYLIRK